jgi:hypothetical protein
MRIHLSDGLDTAVLDDSGPELRWESDRPRLRAALDACVPRWRSRVQPHPDDGTMQIAKMAAADFALTIVKVEGARKRRAGAEPPPPGTVL